MAARTKVGAVEIPTTVRKQPSPAFDEMTGSLPRLVEIPLEYLNPHPHNPRRDLGDLTELAESIKATGIRQPLTVVPYVDTDGEPDPTYYRTVIGHRRAAAAARAGLTSVPAIVDESLSPAQQLELMLVENVQRTDLTVVEEADGYQGLLDLGLDVDAIVRETGRSESTVRRRLRLVGLPEKAREKLHTGQATLAQADRLSEFEDDPDLVARLAKVLGSADFDNEVAKAVKKITVDRAIARVVAALSAAGVTETPKASGSYQGAAPEGMEQVGYLTRYDLGQGSASAKVTSWLEQRLSEVDSSWVFRVHRDTYDDVVYLFRPLRAAAAGPAAIAPDPERERRIAQDRAERAEIEERHARFRALRGAFVDGLKSRTITIPQTATLAAFVAARELRTLWTEDGQYPGHDALRQWFGIEPFGHDTTAEQDDAVVFAAIDTLDTAHQLLAFAVLIEEEVLSAWNYADARTGEFYDLLARLGYGTSTEEHDALTARAADAEEKPDEEADEDLEDDVDDEGDEG